MQRSIQLSQHRRYDKPSVGSVGKHFGHLFCCCPRPKKKSIRPDRYQMPWPGKTGRLSRKPHTPTTTGVYSTSQYECSPPTWWLHQKAQTNQGATLPRGWIEGEGPAGPAWHQDIEMIPEIQGRSTPESQPSPALWCMTVSEQRRILSMIRDPAADQISDGELHTVSCPLSILAHACDTFLPGGSFTAHPEQAPTQLGVPDQQRCESYLAYSYSLADNVSIPITPRPCSLISITTRLI